MGNWPVNLYVGWLVSRLTRGKLDDLSGRVVGVLGIYTAGRVVVWCRLVDECVTWLDGW